MSLKRYYELKAKKICVYCKNKQAAENSVGCLECNKRNANRVKERRKWYKENGYCPRCQANKLYGEEKVCPECLAQCLEYMAKPDVKEHYKEAYKKAYIRDKEKLKEQNICMSCRKNQRYEDHIYCKNCLIKRREGYRRRMEKKNEGQISRAERPNYGLCYFCGAKAIEGKKTCQACTDRIVSHLPQNIDNKKHYWRGMDQLIKSKV